MPQKDKKQNGCEVSLRYLKTINNKMLKVTLSISGDIKSKLNIDVMVLVRTHVFKKTGLQMELFVLV